MSKFNARLRELRTSRKLSQRDLASCLGISKSSVNMYECGNREPGIDTLEAIADFFNVDLDYLSGKTSEIKSFSGDFGLNNALTLDANEKKIIDAYRGFNDEGKEKVLDTISDMQQLDRYKKRDESSVVQKEA